MGFWLGRSWLARLFLTCKVPSPLLLGPSQACVCVSVCVGGLPALVTAASRFCKITRQPSGRGCCCTAPLQTGRALRAPAPAFCSSGRSRVEHSRLAAEDQRECSGPGRSTCQHAGLHTAPEECLLQPRPLRVSRLSRAGKRHGDDFICLLGITSPGNYKSCLEQESVIYNHTSTEGK